MDAAKKMDVPRPRRRKPLRTVPSETSSPAEDDIIAGPAEMSYEEQRLNHSREVSVNREKDTYDEENLIDPDDSAECTDDDSEPIPERERSVTPVLREGIQNSLNSSKRSPVEDQPTRRSTSLSSNLPTHGHDSEVYIDDMENIPEKRRIVTPVTRAKKPMVRKSSLSLDSASFYKESHRNRETTTNGNQYCVLATIVGILLLVLALYSRSDNRSTITKTKAAITCDHFHTLEQRYTSIDESLWDMLDVNVRRATANAEEREPGTVLFLHYGPTAILDGFINSVTNITAGCFGGTEPIMLNGKYFKRSDIQADYGVFLAQQKEALRQSGVLVVRNFEDVPAQAAQVFHTICDTQEPLVDRAVIFLTLDMLKAADVAKPSGQSATAEVESLLRTLWKDSLGPSVLQPLITRLTENVYRIV